MGTTEMPRMLYAADASINISASRSVSTLLNRLKILALQLRQFTELPLIFAKITELPPIQWVDKSLNESAILHQNT
jgi:hypothetical protein